MSARVQADLTSPPPPAGPRQAKLRVAAIDAGSNAIRFVAADFARDAALAEEPSIVARLRFPVRLGHGVFTQGLLDADAMGEAAKAFRDFRAELDRLGLGVDPRRHRAVATSATREAVNRDEFLTGIQRETGILLEPVSGAEEARLVHLAARRRVNFSGGRWWLVDLGGGSVEVSVVNDRGIFVSKSHRLGTVRLLETMTAAGKCSKTVREWVAEALQGVAVPDVPRSARAPAGDRRPVGFAATGGNAEAVAKLALGQVDPSRAAVISKRQLDAVVHVLAAMTVRERIEKLGLRPDRADVVLPAALVYQYFAELAGVDRVVLPNVGLKDGVLLELAAEGRRRHGLPSGPSSGGDDWASPGR